MLSIIITVALNDEEIAKHPQKNKKNEVFYK